MNEKDCVVKIQDLVCYWDKVRLTQEVQTLSVMTRSELSSAFLFFQMLEAPTLQNVSFTVKPEQLVAVIGPVGAGKVCAWGLQQCTQLYLQL